MFIIILPVKVPFKARISLRIMRLKLVDLRYFDVCYQNIFLEFPTAL